MKNKELEEANEIVINPAKAKDFIETLSKNQPVIDKMVQKFEEFPIVIEMCKSYFKKEYTYLPIPTIAGIVATILYIINPFDLIPDVLPGVGQLDDAALVYVCLVLLDKDIERYKEWKKENK